MLSSIIKQAVNASRYSFGGLKYLFASEFAARIEVYAFLWLFPTLIYLKLPLVYLISSLLLFAMLMAIEALNTAVEVIVDRVSPEISNMAKHAKDLGSFAVMCLITANMVHLCYALTKIDWVSIKDSLPLLISLTALILGLYLAVKSNLRKRSKFILPILCGLYILGLGVFIASDYFTGAGFDHKVIYHLKAGFGGAGFDEYLGLIGWMTAYSIIGCGIVYLCFDIFGNKKRNISNKIEHFVNRKIRIGREEPKDISKAPSPLSTPPLWITSSAFLIAFAAHPLTSDLGTILKTQSYSAAAPSISEYELYVQPNEIPQLTRKKNIVFIYAEGLERTYFNEDIFPNLVPNLSEIEKKSIYFNNIRQVYNTEWTVAGLVGTQCGVPMYTPSQGNTMNAYDQFVPNALCMGDILKSNGYYLEFMGGSDLDFAGKGKFFETHGFDKIVGKEDHIKDSSNDDRYSGWGLHDDALLEDGYERFEALSRKKRPFGLVLLTLDTHPPNGHISTSCEGTTYKDGKSGMLNAVKCADGLIANYIQKLKNSPYADDTLIVVASDHVSMNHSASSLLKDAYRRNLFFIIDPSSTPQKIERASSVLDIGPTVLSFLGMKDTGIGFGRNIFGEEQTLIEQVPDPVDVFLIRMGKLMQKELWGFPKLANGMVYDADEARINIGRRWVSLPVVLTLSEDDEIADIEFNTLDISQANSYLAKKLPKAKKFIWADKCKNIKKALNEKLEEHNTQGIWCAAYGTQKASSLTLQNLKDNGAILPQDFSKTN